MSKDHNKLLNVAARKSLKPLGLTRKGSSRVWLDDHGWWLIKVEFQPSAWSKGSYLNVGVCWLFFEGHDSAFHVGHRVDTPFIEFRKESDFERAAAAMATAAREEVEKYRERFATIELAAEYYLQSLPEGGWPAYNSAVILGLTGRVDEARIQFERAIDMEMEYDWRRGLLHRVQELVKILPDRDEFAHFVRGIVYRARSQAVLQDSNGSITF